MNHPKDLVVVIVEALQKTYGHIAQPAHQPLSFIDILVCHILKPKEHQKNVAIAYLILKNEFVDWNEVRVSHLREIYALFNHRLEYHPYEKAHHLREMLSQVFFLCNTMNLDFLWEQNVAEIHKFLQQVHGVDENFLGELLAYMYPREDIPLATVVHRVGKTIGLWDENGSLASLEKIGVKPNDDDMRFRLYNLLGIHGYRLCTEIDPGCTSCAIAQHCQYYQQHIAQFLPKLARRNNNQEKSKHSTEQPMQSIEEKTKRSPSKSKPSKQIDAVEQTENLNQPDAKNYRLSRQKKRPKHSESKPSLKTKSTKNKI